MTFDLPDDWVWDFWLAQHDGVHHLFFLHAPRSLGDPDLRHRHARVGHAVSTDLRSWQRLADPLPPVTAAYDDLATWTGCVVRGGDGLWRLFTSGLSRADDGRVQRIGVATSTDLTTWARQPLLLEADPRWYDVTGSGEVHWRDPFVVRGTNCWHMYVTARVAVGNPAVGVVGHATSADLLDWQVQPPLSTGGPFDQLEVMQVVEVDGAWVMVFSCLAGEIPGAGPGAGGVWCAPIDGPGSRVDLDAAYRLVGEEWYVGKLARDPDGGWGLLAFRHRGPGGDFVGGICDPMPLAWVEGRLAVVPR